MACALLRGTERLLPYCVRCASLTNAFRSLTAGSLMSVSLQSVAELMGSTGSAVNRELRRFFGWHDEGGEGCESGQGLPACERVILLLVLLLVVQAAGAAASGTCASAGSVTGQIVALLCHRQRDVPQADESRAAHLRGHGWLLFQGGLLCGRL